MAKPKAKTLKDLNDQITSVKATMLELRLGHTIMGTYVRDVDALFTRMLQSKSGNIRIPTLEKFLTDLPELRGKLIDLYNRTMNGVKGFDQIPDNIKAVQGALLDGLCYICNTQTDEVTVATMNLSLLYDLDVELDMRKQIMDKNLKGLCKAYRIDVEYINGDQEFTFKAVNARNYDIDAKSDTDPEKVLIPVPYIAGLRLMKMCEYLLSGGKAMLRVRQSTDGGIKVRYLTENPYILQDYCDDAVAVSKVHSNYFPLKCFFYAPSVGSPSTSAMVSRVNLFNVDSIKPAVRQNLDRDGIKKPENPIRDMIGERFFISAMMKLKGESIEKFAEMLKKLSYQGKLFKNPEDIGVSELGAYLHSVPTTAAREKAYRMTGVLDDINQAMSYFGSCRPMTDKEMENLEDTLSNSVCKFIIRKSNCSLGSVFVTNCSSYLSAVYGKGYFGIYEGFNARFKRFSTTLSELFTAVEADGDYSEGSEIWADMRDDSEYYGMPFDDEIYEDLVEKAKEYMPQGEETYLRHMKAMYAKLCNVDLKRSEAAAQAAINNLHSGIIPCRSLNGYVDASGKVVEYFKNLDKSKILSATVFE
jgi:hypothetical protein